MIFFIVFMIAVIIVIIVIACLSQDRPEHDAVIRSKLSGEHEVAF